ncbi:hypothetical protein GF389_06330 [Candidatus Dojkabacteria bacterium]|nr:hypothetical protein [Candidatus Dojkabacteria bacterium]
MSIVVITPDKATPQGEKQQSQLKYDERDKKYYLQLTQESYQNLSTLINPQRYLETNAYRLTPPATDMVDYRLENDLASITLSIDPVSNQALPILEKDLKESPNSFITNPIAYASGSDQAKTRQPSIQVTLASTNDEDAINESILLIPNTLLEFSRTRLSEGDADAYPAEISFFPKQGRNDAMTTIATSPEVIEQTMGQLDEFLARAVRYLSS